MKIEENILLREFTTFRTGGAARYFCRAKSAADLSDAIAFAKEKSIPFFVLGGGSNLLVSDSGFSGLVIKMEISGMNFRENADGSWQAEAGAGENWDGLVTECVRRGLSGVENLSWIPGTVGAAPVQNIGAYGVEAKDSIISVEVFDTRSGKADVLPAADCKFSYRDSIFKHEEGKDFIITRVIFRLQKNVPLKAGYKDVALYFMERNILQPTLLQMREAIIAIRTAKLPDISILGTAGSFFKNPVVAESVRDALREKYPELPSFADKSGYAKIPAAWILDKICGFKGAREGDVGTYRNQALVIVNYGEATAEEIDAFAKKMEKEVEEKTGIKLEREVVQL